MKKKIAVVVTLVMIVVIVMIGVMIAGQPVTQVWIDPDSVEFPIDVNQTNGRLIAAVRIEADVNEVAITQEIAPHDYPVTVIFYDLPAGARVEGATFYWKPAVGQLGVHYFTVQATDHPPFYVRSRTITGVWAVCVVPMNEGPVLIPFVR